MELNVKGFEATQHCKSNSTGGNRADLHRLQIVGPLDAVGDVPTAVDDPLVRGDIVAHQRQDHHHDMLGDADTVAVRDFCHGDPALHCGFQVDMVRADPGCDRELQFRSLDDALGG